VFESDTVSPSGYREMGEGDDREGICGRCKGINIVLILRCVGFCVGCAVAAIGIYQFYLTSLAAYDPNNTIKDVVNALYRVIFGFLIILAELRFVRALAWFSFLTHYLGLGLFHIFIGGLALPTDTANAPYDLVIAIIAGCTGGVYVLFGCACRSMEQKDEKFKEAQEQNDANFDGPRKSQSNSNFNQDGSQDHI